MGKNWLPTVAGFLAAFGLLLSQMDNPTVKMVGLILGAAGTAMLGLVAKQFNVTGGVVPQASPPGVAIKSDALGVIDAVDAMKRQGSITLNEVVAKTNAEAIIAAPPVSPADVNLCK